MHRIDATGHVDSRFRDGDNEGAEVIPPTIPDAAWLNAVQEEIASIIEGAGLELDKAQSNQLAQACRLKIKKTIEPILGAIDHLRNDLSLLERRINDLSRQPGPQGPAGQKGERGLTGPSCIAEVSPKLDKLARGVLFAIANGGDSFSAQRLEYGLKYITHNDLPPMSSKNFWQGG